MQQVRIPLTAGADHQSPKRIVVHAMGEYILDTESVCTIQDFHAVDFLRYIELSVHAIITPSGVVIRCRESDQGAYHAKGFNKDSLGVEFLVPGGYIYSSFLRAIKHPYLTKQQYDMGVKLVKGWMKKYNITTVDRHSDLDPKRKKDPGDGFPWQKFLKEIKNNGNH